MINVRIKKENNQIKEISISGHAGYAKHGKDIVCAAASSVVTTSINAILSLKKSIDVIDDGNFIRVKVLENDEITEKLLENMINLLKEIENQYKKNISVRMEEK